MKNKIWLGIVAMTMLLVVGCTTQINQGGVVPKNLSQPDLDLSVSPNFLTSPHLSQGQNARFDVSMSNPNPYPKDVISCIASNNQYTEGYVGAIYDPTHQIHFTQILANPFQQNSVPDYPPAFVNHYPINQWNHACFIATLPAKSTNTILVIIQLKSGYYLQIQDYAYAEFYQTHYGDPFMKTTIQLIGN